MIDHLVEGSAKLAPVPGSGRPPSTLPTLNDDGSRRWIKPKPAFGRFWSRRRAVAYFLIALFTLIPYLSLNGKPFVLLDLPARRFTIAGFTFLPTDTLLLALFMLGVFVTVFLMTALAGRVWCGWACPQTVYLEFVYRPIERLFEGTPGRVNKSKFVGSPQAKVLKFITYFVVSCYLAHTFLSYFVGVEQLRHWITGSPADHPVGFGVMAATTALMMFDFSYFREQTCFVACPYGRFQSVMLDRKSLIVSYDARRGEPRGRKHGTSAKLAGVDLALPVLATAGAAPASGGDCIDCKQCVQCCPTGIDIRNGLQMECVNCTQCIDACDSIMDKIGKPRGLIRYSSQEALAGAKVRLLRPRVILYPTLLTIIATAFTLVLLTKQEADLTMFRGRGAPFYQVEPGRIANPVSIKLQNRRDEPVTFTLAPVTEGGNDGLELRTESLNVTIEGGEIKAVPGLLVIGQDRFVRGKVLVKVRVTTPRGFSEEAKFEMMGPGNMHAAPGTAGKGETKP